MDDLVRFFLQPPFHVISIFVKGLSPEAVGSSSMFSGDEEIFAFARACSRLVQMGSREWAETASL